MVSTALAMTAVAAERELDRAPAPSTTDEIESPIQSVFPEEPPKPPLFPGLRERLRTLPPFLAEMELEARYRTYFLDKNRPSDVRSEAWAMGGSVYFRSGWFEDFFAVEVEGFTSQPIHAPDDRGGTLLLKPVQNGYSVLGIANGKLRHMGLELTGFRQYFELPYFNRNDSRMTPNTFESVTLTKPEGELRFTTGYTWKVKLRNSDEFISMTEAIGLERDKGLAHGGAIWEPSEDFHVGALAGAISDVFAGIYSEIGVERDLTKKLQARFDGQFSYQWDVGDDLLGEQVDDTWILGLRAAASYQNAVIRIGASVTGPDGSILNAYGTNPSYVDLMQRSFNRPDEKSLLASVSFDFSRFGVSGLSVIVNFVAGFDGKLTGGGRADAQETDVTLDYRVTKGRLANFWLRARGSWLHDDAGDRDGTDFRVILRYDFPVL
jgi:hypothetical protein